MVGADQGQCSSGAWTHHRGLPPRGQPHYHYGSPAGQVRSRKGAGDVRNRNDDGEVGGTWCVEWNFIDLTSGTLEVGV